MIDIWSTSWTPLSPDAADAEIRSHAVYQVRLTDAKGQPLPIGRLGGIDTGGILYIGKSDNLSRRLTNWERGPHSGGETYALMRRTEAFARPPLEDGLLEYRARYPGDISAEYPALAELRDGPDSEIAVIRMVAKCEVALLARYFSRFGELPPCNSKFESKHREFSDALGRKRR